LIEDAVIVCFETNAYFLLCHASTPNPGSW
jgi:hypothetical protein